MFPPGDELDEKVAYGNRAVEIAASAAPPRNDSGFWWCDDDIGKI